MQYRNTFSERELFTRPAGSICRVFKPREEAPKDKGAKHVLCFGCQCCGNVACKSLSTYNGYTFFGVYDTNKNTILLSSLKLTLEVLIW